MNFRRTTTKRYQFAENLPGGNQQGKKTGSQTAPCSKQQSN